MGNIRSSYMKIFIALASSFLMNISASNYISHMFNCKNNQKHENVRSDEYIDDEDFYEENRWNRCKRAGQAVVGQSWRMSSWGFNISKNFYRVTKNVLDGSSKALWNAYSSTSNVKNQPFSYASKTGEIGTKGLFITGYIFATIGKKAAEWTESAMQWAENASYNRYKNYLDQGSVQKVPNNNQLIQENTSVLV